MNLMNLNYINLHSSQLATTVLDKIEPDFLTLTANELVDIDATGSGSECHLCIEYRSYLC